MWVLTFRAANDPYLYDSTSKILNLSWFGGLGSDVILPVLFMRVRSLLFSKNEGVGTYCFLLFAPQAQAFHGDADY